jgi:hypothetical protein
MGLEGRTQTALAQLHGVTNAAFSKQVLGWLDIFDLTPPRGCRSLRTRDNLTKARQLLRQKRPIKAAADGKTRRRNRYPDRSADPTVVFVRGLDLFGSYLCGVGHRRHAKSCAWNWHGLPSCIRV